MKYAAIGALLLCLALNVMFFSLSRDAAGPFIVLASDRFYAIQAYSMLAGIMWGLAISCIIWIGYLTFFRRNNEAP